MTLINQERKFGFTSNQLRFLALFFMLLDHMWATVISGQHWMTCVGRLAFPIFAFLIAEGYAHTHDKKAYAKRLFWFGVISEVPFNYMMMASPIFPFHQNVMFTLLLGLGAIHCWEKARLAQKKREILGNIALCGGCVALGAIGMTDYGAMGVTTVLVFWVSRYVPYSWLFELLCMIMLNVVTAQGEMLQFMLVSWKMEMPLQGFAVLALPLIWLYNGKKGRTSKPMQYAAYAFYPIHMLVLHIILTLR